VADAKLAIMTTQYYTASSIDGFIADPDNSLSWLFQVSEPSGTEDEFPRFIAKVGAIAMGSSTSSGPPMSGNRPRSSRTGPGPLSVTRRSTATSHRHQRRTA
jgi:hypothetical protein